MKKTLLAALAVLLTLLLAALLLRAPGTAPAGDDPPAVTDEADAPSPAPAVNPSSAPTSVPTVEERAAQLLAEMTPQQKVWQLFYVFPQDLVGETVCTDPETWADALRERGAGGVIISTENMVSEESLRALLACIRGSTELCPFLGVDEEGGAVARLHYTLGANTGFKSMFYYKDGGPELAYENARTIARELADFGFNQDFAPVADVWTNPDNSVIGRRAYSDDAGEAAELVAAAVRGFSDGGVLSTLKHFPGHGDTAEDSHSAAAYSSKSREELYTCELLPFMAGIEAGADMVMAGHICLPSLDGDTPATLSPVLIDGLLRRELGWDGVVITDSFAMGAISSRYTQADAAVLAVEAGCDLLLGVSDPAGAAEAVLERVDMARIDESVLRILTLKLRRGLIAYSSSREAR